MNSKKLKGLILLIFFLFSASKAYGIRIKDLANIQGVRDNQLVGYGLVVGLTGTGDKQGTQFTIQTLASMLKKMGIEVNAQDIKVKNVAAVVVTANLPPFAKPGSRIDVLVSSIGDAGSLEGGTLVLTPLKAANQEVYAVAQGPISLGGFSASGGGGESVQKNHLTAGKIPGGALIEKEVSFQFNQKDKVIISLRNPDFTTVSRISKAINGLLGEGTAQSVDAGNVEILVPEKQKGNLVPLMTAIESLDVVPDTMAKVVLDEKTGTVVIGENVRISTVAISHGNLNIQIKSETKVSQPAPFSQGTTATVRETDTSINEENAKLILIPEGVNIGEVVSALNAVGVTPRDLIIIFQAIKAAGALQGVLEII